MKAANHEWVHIHGTCTDYMKVPGGWIYKDSGASLCFVPEPPEPPAPSRPMSDFEREKVHD